MNKKILVFILAVVILPFVHPTEAQQQAKVPKIGWLGARSASATGIELFRREFRVLGYVDGMNIIIESRHADDKLDRLPALADELVSLKVDVLLTPSAAETVAAKNATRTVPIVFLGGDDPVAAGLVDSLARPGETSRGSPALGQCWLANDLS